MGEHTSYTPPVRMPAPRWCRVCETFVQASDFERHRRFEHGVHPTIPVVLAQPPRPELACIRCGKTFASFCYWQRHEDACVEQTLEISFIHATPLIVDVN